MHKSIIASTVDRLDNMKLMLKGEKPYYAQFQNNIYDEEVDFIQVNCKLAY